MKLRFAISGGDPCGIGYEVIAKALVQTGLCKRARVSFCGAGVWWERTISDLGLQDPGVEIVDVGYAGEIVSGKLSPVGGEYAYRSILSAVDLCKKGEADALITAPINKKALFLAGYSYNGHTELLKELFGTGEVVMFMVSPKMKVGLLTTHIPIRDVSRMLSFDVIESKVLLIVSALRQFWGIVEPKIAMCGLNPHAGEGGVMGKEEIEILAPVCEQLRGRGVDVEGPLPADTVFLREDFDAFVAVYHDQGLIPFKLLSFGKGVNTTLGLPVVRTSPDHGTAMDIAGKGLANSSSMESALLCAEEMVKKWREGFSS